MGNIVSLEEARMRREEEGDYCMWHGVCTACCHDGIFLCPETTLPVQMECPECGRFTLGYVPIEIYPEDEHED